MLSHDRLYYQVERSSRPRRGTRHAAGALYHWLRRLGAALDPRFAALLGAFGCPVLPMRYESAELAKIAINFCLVASIGVAIRSPNSANTMGRIGRRLYQRSSSIAGSGRIPI